MARNRKREDVALQWGTLIRAMLASLAIAGLGIGYVRQSIIQDRLGREKSALEERLNDLAAAISEQESRLVKDKSPEGLQVLLSRHGVMLTNPPPNRRIYLPLPAGPTGSPPSADVARGGRGVRPAARTTLATLNAPNQP